jgi:hypothetical protein
MVTPFDPVSASIPRAAPKGLQRRRRISQAQTPPAFAMFFVLMIMAFLIWVLATA